MNPGRELDALIAEKVMGHIVVGGPIEHGMRRIFQGPRGADSWWIEVNCQPNYIPYYSTEIAAAWEVVEKLKGQSVDLNFGEDNNRWECSFIIGGERYSGYSTSAPHCICLAALKTIEMEKK